MKFLSNVMIVITLALISHVAVAQEEDQPSDRMKAYADLIRAQGDFELARSQSALNYARAELERAKAAFEWQRVRAIELLVDQLEYELRQIRRQRGKLTHEIRVLNSTIDQVSRIHRGEIDSKAIRGLNKLRSRYVDAGTIRHSMFITVEALDESFFEQEYNSFEVVAFPGGNVGSLIEHLRRNKIKLAPWTEAHLKLIEALEVMAADAENKLADIEQRMDRIPEIVRGEINPKLPPPNNGGGN